MSCGERTFKFVTAFLSNRTATVGIGQLRSKPFQMSNAGTPQGSIISPPLFNISMIKIAIKLRELPNIGHVIYADDITIWATQGSTTEKERHLQNAVNWVVKLAGENRLQCAPQKPEIVRIHAHRSSNKEEKIAGKIGQSVIPERDHIRVLGMTIQRNGRADLTIEKITKSSTQLARIVKRITKERAGLREEETLRIMQALVTSRLAYSLPYHNLNKQEEERINIIIRTAYKAALGLPLYTSTEKFFQLGVYNTFEEIKEALLIAQKERLATTKTGRSILWKIGSPPERTRLDVMTDLKPEQRSHIKILPLPKNMDPTVHKDRRQARVKYLSKKFKAHENTVYTDAGTRDKTNTTLGVTDFKGGLQDCMTIRQSNTEEAETGAILMAVRLGEKTSRRRNIITDSKRAVLNLAAGRIPKRLKNLLPPELKKKYNITWCPEHEGLEGNEAADKAVRELTHRTPDDHAYHTPLPEKYGERLSLIMQKRSTFPTPHKELNAIEAQILRQIQTNTYPHKSRLAKMFPNSFQETCTKCGEIATLFHATWACPRIWPQENNSIQINPIETWEAALTSSSLEDQLRLIQRAKVGAVASGALDVGPHP